MINSLIRYFDLYSNERAQTAFAHAGARQKTLGWMAFGQYLALSGGVVLEPYLRHYVTHSVWNVEFDQIVGRMVFGAIVGAIILPSVYKSYFDPGQPYWLQFLGMIPTGIGWQSIVGFGFEAVPKVVG